MLRGKGYVLEIIDSKSAEEKERKEISVCVKRQKWTNSTSEEKEKEVKDEEADGSTMSLGKRERSLKLWKGKEIEKREKETNRKATTK